MKFKQKYQQIMKEGLLEGQADYNDVLDSLSTLATAIEEFKHIYPMDRGTQVHAAYKAEVERVTARIKEWTNKQQMFVKHKATGSNPTPDADSLVAK